MMMITMTMLILTNQSSGLFNDRYFKKEYTCTIFIFLHADRHINNRETNRQPFTVRYNNSQRMQKMTKTRNGKNLFFKILSLAFDKS